MESLLPENKVKIPIQTRVEAYNLMNELKEQNISKTEIVNIINNRFKIPYQTTYHWYQYNLSPFGKKRLVYNKELFYVIGALLGDGCAYHWKKMDRHMVILSGEKEFINKYSLKLSKCVNRIIKGHIVRGKNIWQLTTSNFELYSLFKKIRDDFNYVHSLIKKSDYKTNSLFFIEGFFDAEGCVKIIKEEVRKTPKICLDICSTDFKILELIRILLKKHLGAEAKYSIQKSYTGRDNIKRKTCYHLRLYKKEFIRKFFENMNTIKLKPEKIEYVDSWLNNGK